MSFDDIFHNAQLFEEAMERINGMRNSIHDKNYVIGIGMGGLVARYALKNMEQQGKVHDVCKYISINTPHKGANIPIGLQALVRYIQNLKIL
jgi:triacylglycerol esterase/lipase EstA (alpha/beta hydrolase family)